MIDKERVDKAKKQLLESIEEIKQIDCSKALKLRCKEFNNQVACTKFIEYYSEIQKYNLLCALTNNSSESLSITSFKCVNNCLNEN